MQRDVYLGHITAEYGNVDSTVVPGAGVSDL